MFPFSWLCRYPRLFNRWINVTFIFLLSENYETQVTEIKEIYLKLELIVCVFFSSGMLHLLRESSFSLAYYWAFSQELVYHSSLFSMVNSRHCWWTALQKILLQHRQLYSTYLVEEDSCKLQCSVQRYRIIFFKFS
jgi:hypothetical protein